MTRDTPTTRFAWLKLSHPMKTYLILSLVALVLLALVTTAKGTEGEELIDCRYQGACDTYGTAQDVVVVGNYAYMADGVRGLSVMDVSDRTNPQEIGDYDTEGYARAVAVEGNHAYLADWDEGLAIVDISDKDSPELDSVFETSALVMDVVVDGDYAYLADDTNGLVIVDVSSKSNPKEKGSYDNYGGNAYGVAVDDDYAYLANGYHGLIIVDIQDKSDPKWITTYDAKGDAYGVTVAGDYAYVSVRENGIVIIDISDRSNPGRTAKYNTAGDAYASVLMGDYLGVADYGAGFLILDITNKSAPEDAGGYDTAGQAVGLDVLGNYAYIADKDKGLKILELAPVARIEDVSPQPAQNIGQLSFSAGGTDQGTITSYAWRSSLDGEFYNGTASQFDYEAYKLAAGTHTLFLKVQDEHGSWSKEVNTTVILYPASSPSDYEAGLNPCPISLTSSSQTSPSIHGNTIVWADESYGNSDIFSFDLDNPGQISQLTFNYSNQKNPYVFQNIFMWTEDSGDVYVFDSGGVEDARLICQPGEFPLSLEYSMNCVVWTELAGDGDLAKPFGLYIYDDLDREKEKMMNFGGDYALSQGDLLYFEEPRVQFIGEERTVLKIHDPFTDRLEKNLTFLTNPGHIENPDFWEDYVVWEDGRLDESGILEDGNTDIYFLDLSEEKIGQITVDDSTQEGPKVQGDHIIWTDKRSGKSAVYAYSISQNKYAVLCENESDCLDPELYGNYVVWTSSPAGGNSRVYLYDLEEANWLDSPAIFEDLVTGMMPADGKLVVTIEGPASGSTVSGLATISGGAWPSPFEQDPDRFPTIVGKVDDGHWVVGGTSINKDGYCSWTKELNTLALENGIHTFYVAARTYNETSGENEFISDIHELELLVDNDGSVELVQVSPWKKGDVWSWEAYYSDTGGRYTTVEEVTGVHVERLGQYCYELEVYIVGGTEKGTVWLAERDFSKVDSDFPDPSLNDFCMWGVMEYLDFPFVTSPDGAPFTWSAREDVTVEAGTYSAYKYMGINNMSFWYSPEARHVVKTQGDQQGMNMTSIDLSSSGEDQGDDESFLFQTVGPLPLIGYIGILAFLVVVFIGLAPRKKDDGGGPAASSGNFTQAPPGPPPQQPGGQMIPPMGPQPPAPYSQPPNFLPAQGPGVGQAPPPPPYQGARPQVWNPGPNPLPQTPQPPGPTQQQPPAPVAPAFTPTTVPNTVAQQPAAQQPAAPQQAVAGRTIPEKVKCPKCSMAIVVDKNNRSADGKVKISCPACGTSGSI